ALKGEPVQRWRRLAADLLAVAICLAVLLIFAERLFGPALLSAWLGQSGPWPSLITLLTLFLIAAGLATVDRQGLAARLDTVILPALVAVLLIGLLGRSYWAQHPVGSLAPDLS